MQGLAAQLGEAEPTRAESFLLGLGGCRAATLLVVPRRRGRGHTGGRSLSVVLPGLGRRRTGRRHESPRLANSREDLLLFSELWVRHEKTSSPGLRHRSFLRIPTSRAQ